MGRINPQGYINTQIADGNDIVFGEDHGAIASTMKFMEETIRQNAGRIGGVSLEFPPEVQPYIDQAANGEISQETFSKQMRITLEQSYLDTAGSLLNDGRITQDQYDGYETFINDRITGVVTGNTDLYSEDALATDRAAFDSMYDMIGTANDFKVPVAATDVDREFPVLQDLNEAYLDDWIERLDDTSDFSLFQEQFDVESDKQFLVHRGNAHTLDINGNATGLDDHLEAAGRNVTTIGNYDSLETLTDQIGIELNDYGHTIEDDTDMTIVDRQGYEEGAVELHKAATVTLSPGM